MTILLNHLGAEGTYNLISLYEVDDDDESMEYDSPSQYAGIVKVVTIMS